MPSKRNKRNNYNKQKTNLESPYVESTVVHIEPSNVTGCIKSGFTVIPNNGIVSEKREHYTSSCFFKSISDYFCLTTNRISAIKIRQCIKFPKESIEVDTVLHAKYIQTMCDMFKISVAFFTVNTDDIHNNYKCWIGNPCIIFKPTFETISSRVSIASYGAHYELIVSETPFSPNLMNRCTHYKVKTHEFYYGQDVLLYTEGGHVKMTYRNAVKSSQILQETHVNQISRVDLELQLTNAQSNRIQQESLTEILKQEIIKLSSGKKTSSVECRLHSLCKMIQISTQCCEELSDNIAAIRLQLQLC